MDQVNESQTSSVQPSVDALFVERSTGNLSFFLQKLDLVLQRMWQNVAD